MAACYDLYGSRFEDLESARAEVERVLGVKFEAHESDFHGGDIYRSESRGGGESFLLKRNFDAIEGERFEDKVKEYSILLHVDDTPRPEEIQKRLEKGGSSFALLRRRTICPSVTIARPGRIRGRERFQNLSASEE